jgi:cytochrome P460
MKRIIFLLVPAAMVVGITAGITERTGHANQDQVAAPMFLTEKPSGFREWKFISVAHEEGNLNSFAAVLGNDVAIKAYRDKTLPFPDGNITP